MRVLHLADRLTWAAARASGWYRGSTRGADLARAGFVHTCTRAQLAGATARFFAGVPAADLVLLVVDTTACEAVGTLLRWDPVGDTAFPHLYGPVPVGAVLAEVALPAGPDAGLLGLAADDAALTGAGVPLDPEPASGVHLLLVAGRSGVGKSSVVAAVSRRFAVAAVSHAVVDGDALDTVWPKPADDPDGSGLTAGALAVLWGSWSALGHSRVVYVNTASVLGAGWIGPAVGATVVAGVVLTATDATAAARLGRRETGPELDVHLVRSARAAVVLDAAVRDGRAPAGTVRVPTDGRTVEDVAAAVVRHSGWLPGGGSA